MNGDGVDLRGRVQRSPGPQVAIERHDFHMMPTLDQTSTEVQNTALDSSNFWVELPGDLQYSHQGAGNGPTNEKPTA